MRDIGAILRSGRAIGAIEPDLVTAITLEPDPATVTLSPVAPVVAIEIVLLPDPAVVTLSPVAPVLLVAITLQPDPAVVTLSPVAPVLLVAITLQVDPAVVTLSPVAPVLDIAENIALLVDPAVVTLSPVAPVLLTDIALLVDPATVTLSVVAPVVDIEVTSVLIRHYNNRDQLPVVEDTVSGIVRLQVTNVDETGAVFPAAASTLATFTGIVDATTLSSSSVWTQLVDNASGERAKCVYYANTGDEPVEIAYNNTPTDTDGVDVDDYLVAGEVRLAQLEGIGKYMSTDIYVRRVASTPGSGNIFGVIYY